MIILNGMPDISEVIKKNQDFVCEFIDIKTNGFHQFALSLDKLTYSFWKPLLNLMEENVNNFGIAYKNTVRLKVL